MNENEINKDSITEIVSSQKESSIETEGFWWWIAGTFAGAVLTGLTYWIGMRHGKKVVSDAFDEYLRKKKEEDQEKASAEKKEESKKEEPKKDESDKKDESSESCINEVTSDPSKKETSVESNKKD